MPGLETAPDVIVAESAAGQTGLEAWATFGSPLTANEKNVGIPHELRNANPSKMAAL